MDIISDQNQTRRHIDCNIKPARNTFIIIQLFCFAELVEEGYRSNPYHNATHAADVTQAMHCYITQAKVSLQFPVTD